MTIKFRETIEDLEINLKGFKKAREKQEKDWGICSYVIQREIEFLEEKIKLDEKVEKPKKEIVKKKEKVPGRGRGRPRKVKEKNLGKSEYKRRYSLVDSSGNTIELGVVDNKTIIRVCKYLQENLGVQISLSVKQKEVLIAALEDLSEPLNLDSQAPAVEKKQKREKREEIREVSYEVENLERE